MKNIYIVLIGLWIVIVGFVGYYVFIRDTRINDARRLVSMAKYEEALAKVEDYLSRKDGTLEDRYFYAFLLNKNEQYWEEAEVLNMLEPSHMDPSVRDDSLMRGYFPFTSLAYRLERDGDKSFSNNKYVDARGQYSSALNYSRRGREFRWKLLRLELSGGESEFIGVAPGLRTKLSFTRWLLNEDMYFYEVLGDSIRTRELADSILNYGSKNWGKIKYEESERAFRSSYFIFTDMLHYPAQNSDVILAEKKIAAAVGVQEIIRQADSRSRYK
jgi:hypothetical protein